MKLITGLLALVSLLVIVLQVLANPPYDVSLTFDASPGAAGYNLYLDDCAATGAIGAPVNTPFDPAFPTTTGLQSGDTFPGLLTADGTYELCVRPLDATGQELADPGLPGTATIVVGALQGVQITGATVGCPGGPCSVTVTIN